MITGLNAPLDTSSIKTFRDLVCDYQEVKYTYEEYTKINRTTKPNRGSVANFNLNWYVTYVNALYGYSGNGHNSTSLSNPYAATSKDCFSILSMPHELYYVPNMISSTSGSLIITPTFRIVN